MSSIVHYYGLCERTEPGFWGEPFNAFTSLGFLIVAAELFRYYKNHSDIRGRWVWDLHILSVLIVAIGIGSFLFHTMPSYQTELMDILPIIAFINIYFFSALFRVTETTRFEAAVAYIAFAGFTHICVSQFPRAMNDSIGYLSTMTALIMIALYLNMKRRPAARAFLVAAITGVVSLFFRSIDNAVCDIIPIGTHFLWHLFNALLVYMLMRQLIRNVNRAARLKREKQLRNA